MGCASSKGVELGVTSGAGEVYRPPPASIALFDITKIDEPWLFNNGPVVVDDEKLVIKKPTTLPLPFLEKIESLELAPKSWSEVSKALEELKPTLTQTGPPPAAMKAEVMKSPVGKASSMQVELEGFRPVKQNSFLVRDRQDLKICN